MPFRLPSLHGACDSFSRSVARRLARGPSLVVALIAGVVALAPADAARAVTKLPTCKPGAPCDTGDPPPDPPRSKGPPPADPQVAACAAADPNNIPASCQSVLANEITRQRTYGIGTTRTMFHADPNAYPSNLGSTLPANLMPNAGVATNANRGKTQLGANTELSYRSILIHDWATAKGGSLPADASGAGAWAPHAWLSSDGSVRSCQEYVYRKWDAPLVSTSLDAEARCGANGDCLMSEILNRANGPFSSGAPTVSIAPTPWSSPTSIPIAYRQNTVVPKNPFFAVSKWLLLDQSGEIQKKLSTFNTTSCSLGLQGPFPVETIGPYTDWPWVVPSNYVYQNAIGNVRDMLWPMLQTSPVYVIGSANAPAGTTVAGTYANERAMLMDLWNRRLDNVASGQGLAFETAARDRVRHLMDLVALYNSISHWTCADAAAAAAKLAPSSSGGGGGGGGGGGVRPPGPRPMAAMSAYNSTDATTVMPAAYAVQSQIVDALLQELARGDAGCFSANQTVCDIDPYEVSGRLFASFDTPMEQAFSTCVEWTANQVPYTSVTGLEQLIAQKMQADQDALMHAPGIDPSTDGATAPAMTAAVTTTSSTIKRAAVGQIITGSRYMGDADFVGGGYSYGGYWKVTPKDFTGPSGGLSSTPTACELDGQLHAELHGRIDLLKTIGDQVCSPIDAALDSLAQSGKSFDDPAVSGAIGALGAVPGIADVVSFCELRYRMRHLADASLTANAVPGTASYDGSIFFGGQQLWSGSGSIDLPNITAAWPAQQVRVDGPSSTIVVVVVPVTFEVYGEIQYGASGFAHANSIASCGKPSLDAHVQFAPWVTVDAIGSVGIGFSFAQVGVRGKVRVLDARLPVDAFVRVAPDSSTAPELEASAQAKLDLAMLSGSVSAFAEISILGIDEEAEKQLASWDGLKTTIKIFDWNLDPIHLPTFNQAAWNQFQTTTKQ